VHLISEPPNAPIFRNGKPTRKRTPAALKLPLGKASRLELRLKGHRKWIRTVRPVPGEKLTILGKLEKK